MIEQAALANYSPAILKLAWSYLHGNRSGVHFPQLKENLYHHITEPSFKQDQTSNRCDNILQCLHMEW